MVSLSKNVRLDDMLHNVVILYSYDTPVAASINGKFIATSTHYSHATSKHINAFVKQAQTSLVDQSVLDALANR